MTLAAGLLAQGSCHVAFENVRRAFEDNFARRDEIGAAVAVYVDGELVVDLWGGTADAAGTRQWRQDTLAAVYSGTKGLTSTCLHLLADRGVIDLDAPVARYWPEFGQAGKADITVAMVLSHRSGVIGPRRRLSVEETLDWDLVCDRLAAATPWWRPGSAQGYHMVTFGFILGEVVRRVTGRTIGQFLRTEIAAPLGIDVHIGLPVHQHHRCADMVNKPFVSELFATMPREVAGLGDHPMTAAAVAADFIPDDELARRDIASWRAAEFPGTNAHVSALGMATFYNALAQGVLLTRDRMLAARTSQGGFDPDVCLGPRVADHGWGLGYMLNQRAIAGPNPKIFGHGGSGGSYAFVDLEHRIGYAYVMNQFDATKASADPRSVALIDEVYAALGVTGR
ncbi:beta-lactamase family protein [Mycobacterium sp. MYCO198283]|uniref:serine hydrolase domain-containing protein n=1 Tax=Mycobacterium sp. MYCO198283 TaxID=2883505 RepID=UPI001E33B2FE|nr:serine hydrolase domain-containing protein [Mycobacterium sp. MYCO198283]MCG5432988.1 beta-lactamase family protein [Mycobacterium sp. MYCO198283]